MFIFKNKVFYIDSIVFKYICVYYIFYMIIFMFKLSGGLFDWRYELVDYLFVFIRNMF